MKKLYLPTTSLNFNNILSSESVSPTSFYRERLFGYSRWTPIPENPLDNSILLYDYIANIRRHKSDYEDHPMLIEVTLDDETASALSIIDEHTYLIDRTLYLDPFSSRIFFFSEEEERTAKSLSDHSLETKFCFLYRNKISTINPPPKYYTPLKDLHERQPFNIVSMEKDRRINKMKGLLYGFYIGGLLSAFREDVIRLKTLREIHNILVAILASLDHKATPQQHDRLDALYSSIQQEIPFLTELSRIESDESRFRAIVSLIRKEYGYIKGEIDVNKIISQLLSDRSKNGSNTIIDEISYEIRQAEDSIIGKSIPVQVEDSQLVVIDGFLSTVNIKNLSDSDKTIYKAWINDILTKDIYSGRISTFKEDLSDDLTRKAKELYDNTWQGSYPEMTLNALRRAVRGDGFNHQWDNGLYSSIAALLMKGDDWQELLKFMQEKEMTDYRLAFSMFGIINGFANLPRDFTDVLFKYKREYIASVYKEFYGQLFGRDIIVVGKDSNVDQPNQQLEEKKGKGLSPITDETGDSNRIKHNEYDEVYHEFQSLMEGIISTCTGAEKDKSLYYNAFLKCGGFNSNFIETVDANPNFNNGRRVQKKVLKYLKEKIVSPSQSLRSSTASKEAIQPILPLFSNEYPSTGVFLSDFDFLTNDAEFISIMSSVNKKWADDLRWFIDAHDPKHKDYNKYAYKDKPNDNMTVIPDFINFKNGLYKSTKDFLYKVYKLNG